MDFSETGGVAGELPLPPDLKIPDNWEEAKSMLDEVARAEFSREKLRAGDHWTKLRERLEHLDDTYGADDEWCTSFYSTGGMLGRQVLVSSFEVECKTTGGIRPRHTTTEQFSAWSIIVNDLEEDAGISILRYKEFTLLKDLLNVSRSEARATKPVDERWTLENLGACALLVPLADVCYVDRGVENSLTKPVSPYIVPGNIEAARGISSRLEEARSVVDSLSAGMHEEEISTLHDPVG